MKFVKSVGSEIYRFSKVQNIILDFYYMQEVILDYFGDDTKKEI